MNARLWRMLRWLLFHLEAETAHRLVLRWLKISRPWRDAQLRIISRSRLAVEASDAFPIVFGMPFASRVGLAAGFDKDGEILGDLPALGFGFAEIGTVTPRPQPGNPKPRLFRDAERQAIFNLMGFNNAGAPAVARRIARERVRLPRLFRVGINLGKNRDTLLEEAASDYVQAAAAFEGLVDYLVINVSSPNTPGLRSLQSVEQLKPIIGGVGDLIAKWSRCPPLLVKLAPETSGSELAELLVGIERLGIDGWVLTNTLAGTLRDRDREYSGGWSGAPLTGHARSRLREARQVTGLPIISVGGIMSVDEARVRRGLGADLVQIYTGWIYRGPSFATEIARAIAD